VAKLDIYRRNAGSICGQKRGPRTLKVALRVRIRADRRGVGTGVETRAKAKRDVWNMLILLEPELFLILTKLNPTAHYRKPLLRQEHGCYKA
jgi:hypothetical protein